MGSVKRIIPTEDPIFGRYNSPPTPSTFGMAAWEGQGTFSVGDLKHKIPDREIPGKREGLVMQAAAFFEYLAGRHPDIPTWWLGLLDNKGKQVDLATLLERGDTTNKFLTEMAHTPESFCDGDLSKYRLALANGELQCGVADVESIFRNGFPLGSSSFKRIFKAMGRDDYEQLATYQETAQALAELRAQYEAAPDQFPAVQKMLEKAGLTTIPNPGTVLEKFVYDSTTKFEVEGDRDITEEEARRFSGLSDEGYELWTQNYFPRIAQAQIDFAGERGILNIDGKCECIAYKGNPVLTDFACTSDENRLMIVTEVDGVEWAIPSNKEIQRAIFRQAGVYAAIEEAKRRANAADQSERWREAYFDPVLAERKIDLQEVTEHACNLMQYAIAEVTNRILGRTVIDTKPLDSWVKEFVPYASKVERPTA